MTNLISLIHNHDLQRIAELLTTGSNVSEEDPQQLGWTPLMIAVDEVGEQGPVEMVMLLLRHGAPVNVSSSSPVATPLTVAVNNQLLDVTRILLAAGADPNVRTDEGETPLRLAVEYKNIEIAKLLLLCGADRSINTSGGVTGMTALGRAVADLNLSMVDLLIKAGADPQCLDCDDCRALDRLPVQTTGNRESHEAIATMLTQ